MGDQNPYPEKPLTHGDLFNLEHLLYMNNTVPWEGKSEIKKGNTIIKFYGHRGEMESDFNSQWGETQGPWPKEAPAMSVSSNPREIWIHTRANRESKKPQIPLHYLGHEMAHDILIDDKNFIDPHDLRYMLIHPKELK